MRRILLFSFSLAIALQATSVSGQVVNPEVEAQEDTVQQRRKKPDSLKEKIYFRSIRFGTDLLALVLTGFDEYNGWEVNGDLDFGPFYVAGDYGEVSRNMVISNGGDYSNEGTYWRAGLDVSILKKDPDRNMLFFGLRYARSSFSDRASLTVTDPYFGVQQYDLANPAASAVWGEMVAGLRVKIWKEFWMGFTSRLKMGLSVQGNEQQGVENSFLASYYVPGYGNVSDGYTWGFNYQLYWRIPFARKKQPAAVPAPN